ncbi:MAG: recombinase rad51 [Chaenotheca gracillima]|nr:MAG: recombinase rad51 [Chaenotheca gracillima]
MGNLCGKESKSGAQNEDHFQSPGRTLGSAPAPASGRASVPQKYGGTGAGAGRTLGGDGRRSDTTTSKVGGGGGDMDTSDARRAAALAAEERAKSGSKGTTSTGGGGLSAKLAEQKRQTRTATLDQISREERQRRGADDGREALNWE